MPDDSRTPEDAVPTGPRSPQRRKLLITGAFAAASAATLAKMPTSSRVSHVRRRPDEAKPGGSPKPTAPPTIAGASATPGPDHRYDIVIRGGRVIDPDSGFDDVVTVGIDGGSITGFGENVKQGKTTIDATGRVVSPGFIDILSYEPDPRGVWYKIADGVTTNLGMHGMQEGWWAQDFFARYTGSTPVHFGGAFSDHWVRYRKLGLDAGATASASQASELAAILDDQLHQGWLGVAMEPEYTPGVDFAEMVALAEVAQRNGVPCVVHGRYASHAEETRTVPELVRLAETTGATVHIAHLPSTGGTWHITEALEAIDAAVASGLDITFDLYPYDYWATFAASARFAPGWQDRFRITYGDLQVAGRPGRLTASSFATAQAENLLTVAYAIPEISVQRALQHPRSLIGSDAIVDSGNNHPRASGTFCRVLGHWVRERKTLSLPEALSKMTIQPARLLENRCPRLARKGRVHRGADADLCIFDPTTVTDRATVEEPVQYSTGIDWVIVGGTVVKNPSGLQRSDLPGIPIRSQLT